MLYALNEISQELSDKIETDIMSILYTNEDKTFTCQELFDKLIIDKYNWNANNPNNSISLAFKTHFLFILRTLQNKYDDVCVEINVKNTQITSIFLLARTNTSRTNTSISTLDTKYKLQTEILDETIYGEMYYFIYVGNEIDKFNKSVNNGNTYYHELVLNKNEKLIQKLIDNDKFDYEALDQNKNTPIEISTVPTITKILVNGLLNKIAKLKKNDDTKENLIATELLKYFTSDTYKTQIINNMTYCEILQIKTKGLIWLCAMLFLVIIVYFMVTKNIFYIYRC